MNGICSSCGARTQAFPYDWSGKPAIMICFSHDPPVQHCEACKGNHVECGELRIVKDEQCKLGESKGEERDE